MASIKTLNGKRAAIKGQITRMVNFFQSDEINNIEQVEIRAQKLDELFQKFDNIQSAIEELHIGETEEEQESIQNDHDAERDNVEAVYFELSSSAKQILRKAQIENEVPNNNGPRQGGDGHNNNSIHVNLPKLSLMEFEGEYDKWMAFKDTFTSLIQENKRLTDIQRFQYLRSSLKGEALQVISGLTTTAENYTIAWDVLTENYENKKLIINTHVSQLLDFPAIAKDKPATLRQFVVHIRTHLKALEVLKEPVDKWSTLIIHLARAKLDFVTQRDWEEFSKQQPGEDKMPTTEEFMTFLSERCSTLEMIQQKKSTFKPTTEGKPDRKISLASTSQNSCVHCSGDHAIYRCDDFLQLSVEERSAEVNKHQLCSNCLGKGHYARNCRGSSCRKCEKRHNTLLHKEHEGQEKSKPTTVASTVTKEQSADTDSQEESDVIAHGLDATKSQVVLSTAQVYVKDANGTKRKCRALLDAGSQLNVITKNLVRQLGLPTHKEDKDIGGINKQQTRASESAIIRIISMQSDFEADLRCVVLPAIVENLPQTKIDLGKVNIPRNLKLADSSFDTPAKIDLLIGASLFWKLLGIRKIQQRDVGLELRETQLGWILGGEIKSQGPETVAVCNLATEKELQDQIERFWTQEEIHELRAQTKEEEVCENYFKETVARQEDGRFSVRLPKNPNVMLGESRTQAVRRLQALERRFRKQPELKTRYINFLDEYEKQEHMYRVESNAEALNEPTYFIPHQPVIREESMTTKLRVVFDASAKTSLGSSLNDYLLAGPNLQSDLLEIVLRFRTHNYVLTADVAMMYRQIAVDPQDHGLQCILWRKGEEFPIETFALSTVTYGTSCAPYLAMRCLKQLELEDGKYFPAGSKALRHDFYMDDVLTGTNTIPEAVNLQIELSQLLERGKLPLRKWRTNEPRVLEHLAKEAIADSLLVIDKQEPLKTLGLLWDSKKDCLQYRVTTSNSQTITKRTVLSRIAQVFDPLGLVGPVLITAKIIMQRLWQVDLGWDEALPSDLHENWIEYYDSLPDINNLQIPRNINARNISGKINIFGFGDASEKAFGACLYAVCVNDEGEQTSRLIMSKSRVAPLKTVSLPRLELNAAVLLAKLVELIRRAYAERIDHIYLWSDSTIVLGWIKQSPQRLKTYVSNRVSKIQRLTENTRWAHVSSADNPADMLSRGVTTGTLKESSLWWNGPTWLTMTEDWPQECDDEGIELPEMKSSAILAISCNEVNILEKYSSFVKLQRVMAYCLRFIAALRCNRQRGPLTVEELKQSEKVIVRLTQQEAFASELKDLKTPGSIQKKSKIAALSPFVDQDGLLRVGGRLSQADISEDQKHPTILPDKHHVTKLILKREHQRLYHCGPSQLLSCIRTRYWPLSGRREANKITQRCLKCFRYRPKIPEMTMGDLPKVRVDGNKRPFLTTGIDYAGPLLVKESKRRGRVHTSKAWIAIFTCFTTKAVHIELVTELTTEAFLAALRRFTARRGICSQIYSDNGSNFIGADRELPEVQDFLEKEHDEISTQLSKQKITWSFIPPRAPHFGGLWEAAVKSTKKHLYTVTKGSTLTFEECYTVLTEIEAILNSRPVTPLSNDPNDLSVLIPAHFLIGDSLVRPVENNYLDIPDNRLSRWRYIQKIRQQFWQRWYCEYLHELQRKTKWTSNADNVKVGTIVLINEDHQPPLQWALGRIITLHPGADGIVRVVTIRTQNGICKRAVRKLSPIPMEDEL